MSKRIISVILSVLFILSAFTVSFAADEAKQETDAVEIPQITNVYPSLNGATITWSEFEGAAKYYVCLNNGGKWKVIGTSTSNSFEHKNLISGSEYTYTVRAADSSGAFISGYDTEGYSFRYFQTPVLQSVVSINGGLRLNWQGVDGASGYMVYVKYPTGWKAVSRTTNTYYLDTNVTSGKLYYYTVRCWDLDARKAQSYYDRKGISGVYIASPQISGFAPANGGTTVKWNKVEGAYGYRVFINNAGKWKSLGVTTATSFTHKGLTNNTLYTYTVRCVDKSGNFISGYDTKGQTCRYLAPPQITKVSGGTISWNAVPNTAGYRVYRKAFTKSWAALGTSKTTSFKDATAAKNTLYTYTVRCIDESGKLISYFTDNGKYYYNGALANGTYTVGGDSFRFTNGVLIRQGYVTVGGKMYYYNAKGVLQKNGLVGSTKEGFRYADKNGVINLKYTGLATNYAGTWYLKNGVLDRTLRTAVTVSGVDYNILNGRAYKVSTTKDRTLFRALKIVTKVTNSSMTKSQKLKACWDHLRTAYGECNPRNPEYYGTDWPEVYANDIFVDGTGNCFSYAAAFAYLAKAVGYSDCYACNSGGHGWSEVEGLVYDAEWSMHNFNYSYYALSYDTRTDVPYKAALSLGSSYSHVKI